MVTCFSLKSDAINFVRNIKVPGAIRCQEGSVPSAVFVSEGVAREITSPNYPEDNYENGHDCYWHIQAPQGLRIRADVIDLEVRNAQLNWTKLFFTLILFLQLEHCRYCDYVQFYDGNSNEDGVLANYNFRSAPLDVVSSGSHMVIRLRTDGSVTHRGFRISLTAEGPQEEGTIDCNVGPEIPTILRTVHSRSIFSRDFITGLQ